MVDLTRGQILALEQLDEIAECSEGALEILGAPETDEQGRFIRIRLSLATKHYKCSGGFAFRNREKLRLRIYSSFPFIPPSLYFSHTRFMGQPHVQWGNYICLYQSSETEWLPSDGLYGFFQRVDEWMVAAGKGELDPNDAPLHPPVAYSTSKVRFVFDCDAPDIEEQDDVWIGRAELKKKRDGRFDLVNWVSFDDWASEELPEESAAAILLSKPLPMEYPDTVEGIFTALEKSGVRFSLIYSLLKLFSILVQKDNPIYIVLGAPMRRREAGAPLRQHLTVWEIEPTAVNALQDVVLNIANEDEAIAALAKWMVTAKALWCRTFENRSEVTLRRDEGSNLAGVRGKNIILLGCGALGSVIAENLVRAGARSLLLFDNGLVSPGLLVRQNYADRDVGFAKSECLARHLKEIGLSTEVVGKTSDLRLGVVDILNQFHTDLIINATASVPVANTIERDLRRASFLVPLISMSVSAAAKCGSVVVKMPRYDAGIIAIDRLTKLALVRDFPNHPATKAFWPGKEEREIFQPEPGCSTPTFTGSSADLVAQAATLLNLGLHRTQSLNSDEASSDLIVAPWVELGGCRPLGLTLSNQNHYLELRHGYQVLTSDAAQLGVSAEINRTCRVLSKNIETGGLIFGEIDEAHGRIFIDSVTGPPPDSEMSEEKFLCGISGTSGISAAKNKKSGGSSRFIGIWHTHPISRGLPSTDDINAMVQLLHGQEYPPRQVVMLIIGHAASKPQSNYFLFRRRDLRIFSEEELNSLLEVESE